MLLMRSQTRSMQCAGGKRSTRRRGGWIRIVKCIRGARVGQESTGRLSLLKPVEPVEGRGFIALRQGRIIKDGVHEIGDFAFEQKDGLADVQQLGGVFTENMHAEQFEGFAVKQ